MFKKMKSKKGFTLVELLIVLAIIAILAAIAIPMYNAQMDKARKKVDEANLRSAKSLAAAEYMLMDNPPAAGQKFIFEMVNKDNLAIKYTTDSEGNKVPATAAPTKGYNQATQDGGTAGHSYIEVTVKEGGEVTSAGTGWKKIS